MSETYELQFGDLDWSPAAQVDDVQIRVFGLRRGKAVPVVQVVESLIQDGGLERVDRFENRDQQVILAIDATDSQALAEYESTLFREVQKVRNELRYTPPDGFAPAGVFDVLWADLAFADDDALWDLDEVMRGRRNYVLTLRCLPFARSVDPFTVTGVTSGAVPSISTINDASTLTGWFGQPASGGARYTPVLGSGRVQVSTESGAFTANDSLVYSPAAPVSMAGTQYLNVYWQFTSNLGPFNDRMVATADGVTLPRMQTRLLPGGGWNGPFVTTFVCPDTSVAEFVITPPPSSGFVGGSQVGDFEIDALEKSNQAPSTGTLRQKAVNAEVPGSARTATSIEVGHGTTGLGNVLVYTSPLLLPGQSPPLSPYRSGSVTADTALVSGGYFNSSTTTYSVPVAALASGQHQIVIRAQVASWTAEAALQVGGVDVGAVVTGSASATLLGDDGTGYVIYSLGALTLPPHEVPAGSNATVRVTITRASGTARLDESWAFYLPDDGTAHLSAVAAGTRRRVWLDQATVTRPYPAAFIGDAADRSDAYGVDGALSNWDQHVIVAGDNNLHVVTTTALDAEVSLEGYAAWHTHPAS